MAKGQYVFGGVVLLGFLSRVLPHPHNFTPVIAMALVAGAFAARRYVAILLPLLAMLLSDLVINNTIYASYYEGFAGWEGIRGNLGSYVALAVLAILPMAVPAAARARWFTLLGFGLGGPLVFFLISNLGVWIGGGMYPMSAAGLVACLTAGLPFLPATTASTLLYGAVAAATLKGFGISPSPARDYARA